MNTFLNYLVTHHQLRHKTLQKNIEIESTTNVHATSRCERKHANGWRNFPLAFGPFFPPRPQTLIAITLSGKLLFRSMNVQLFIQNRNFLIKKHFLKFSNQTINNLPKLMNF
jgi:hypothetical protein